MEGPINSGNNYNEAMVQKINRIEQRYSHMEDKIKSLERKNLE